MTRLGVNKTYKLFIGGAFPRSESGRTFPVTRPDGDLIAHACLASRKDLRDAVSAARKAQDGWAARTAYNRGQILYRVAEVMETRQGELIAELARAGQPQPEQETTAAIDRWVWYAGWCDKYTQVLGGANPVAGPYFNFSVLEPSGVAGLAIDDSMPLLALTSRLAPALVAGNTAVVVAAQAAPLVAITLAEILATSDVPGGVVNILTGRREELVPWLADHAEVNTVDLTGCDQAQRREAKHKAASTVTRTVVAEFDDDWLSPAAQSPYEIEAFCEVKTVWHPAGR